MLTVELESGKTFESPFAMIKKDRPIEVATYIKNHVIEQSINENTIHGPKRYLLELNE